MGWDEDKSDPPFWQMSCRTSEARTTQEHEVTLVNVVQELHPDIEEAEIMAYYDLYTDLSVVNTEGSPDEDISGDPNKWAVILQDADSMEIWIAFAELIDNILDNHREKNKLLTEIRGNCDLEVDIKCLDIQETNFIQE